MAQKITGKESRNKKPAARAVKKNTADRKEKNRSTQEGNSPAASDYRKKREEEKSSTKRMHGTGTGEKTGRKAVKKDTPVKDKIHAKSTAPSEKKAHHTAGKKKKHRNPVIVFLKFIRNTYAVIGALLLTFVISFTALFVHYEGFYDRCRQKEYTVLASVKENPFRQAGKTVIYDKNGGVIDTLHNTGYKYTKISDISQKLQDTYISSEDKDFMYHIGFSVKGIARAAREYIKNDGRITQGGSTITQQLVKNTFLSKEKTFDRKLTEIFLAVDLEKEYTKAQIMEFYLNTCFYGNNCTGVYAAAEYYFGKKPADLDYGESAMLAAISKSPSINNPVSNPERAIQQRNIVLNSLYEDGKITEQQKDFYSNEEYTPVKHESRAEKINYMTSFAVYCASLQLMKDDGFKFRYAFKDKNDQAEYKKDYTKAYTAAASRLRSGGYKVYTTLDPVMQNTLQKTTDAHMLSVSKEKQTDGRYLTQSASVCIDNETGYVTALVGGRGEKDEYNRAFLSSRQPGSAIKPIADYAPAFDTGRYFPSLVYDDKKPENGPKNSNGSKSSGKITIRDAVKTSSNTVAFNIYKDLGLETGPDYLSALHMSSLSYLDNDSSSLSIGGLTNGVKPVELAGAYAALENGGIWREPTCVTKIKDTMTGDVIKTGREGEQVYKDSSAFLITDCLKDVFKDGGTAKGLSVKGQVCAGKTGTTNDLKDGWFCGYTPYYTTVVWTGNDDGTPLYKNFGAAYSGPLWQDFMTQIHKSLPKASFTKPASVEKMYIGKNGESADKGTKKDYFATEEKETAKKAVEDQTEKENEAALEEMVKRYESLAPSDEWSYFEADDKYDEINDALSAISDTEARNSFKERIKKKKDALDRERALNRNFAMTQAEYDSEKKQKALQEEEAKRKEAQEDQQISDAADHFDKSIEIVYDTDDISTAQDALKNARDNLSFLTGLEEYDKYKEKYDTAAEYLSGETEEDTETETEDKG